MEAKKPKFKYVEISCSRCGNPRMVPTCDLHHCKFCSDCQSENRRLRSRNAVASCKAKKNLKEQPNDDTIKHDGAEQIEGPAEVHME